MGPDCVSCKDKGFGTCVFMRADGRRINCESYCGCPAGTKLKALDTLEREEPKPETLDTLDRED